MPRRVAARVERSTTRRQPYDAASLRALVRRVLIDAIIEVVVDAANHERDPDQAIRRELGPMDDDGGSRA